MNLKALLFGGLAAAAALLAALWRGEHYKAAAEKAKGKLAQRNADAAVANARTQQRIQEAERKTDEENKADAKNLENRLSRDDYSGFNDPD